MLLFWNSGTGWMSRATMFNGIFSENHALLFHTSAYLAGNLLP
ncbi:hypothetical protein [Thalassospira lucentensis]